MHIEGVNSMIYAINSILEKIRTHEMAGVVGADSPIDMAE
jgi:hypothetical protein